MVKKTFNELLKIKLNKLLKKYFAEKMDKIENCKTAKNV